MKVLYISGYPLSEKVSGSLVHAAKMAEYVAAMDGTEVHVITMGTRHGFFQQGRVNVHTVARSWLLNPCLFPLALRKIKNIAAAVKPDVIHGMRGFPYPSIVLSLRKKYPVVLSLFSLPQKELFFDKSPTAMLSRLFLDIPAIKYAIPRLPHIIVQTRFMAGLIEHDTKAKIHIIPEGIECDRLRALAALKPPASPPDIFIAVSFRKLKGIDVLLDAVPAVLKSVPGLQVCIGGAGEEDANLKNQVKELGLAEHVTFPGFITDEAVRYGWYGACKIVAVPSRWDNEPFAALDGAALGKPVIASAAANASVVVDGRTGFVVPSEDVAALSDRIVTLLTDDRLRAEMGRAITQKVKEYDWPVIAGKTADVYREAIADFQQNRGKK